MTNHSIIEAMARAHWDSSVGEVGDWDRFVRVAGADHWEVQEELKAQRAAFAAAIQEMREPSEGALNAARDWSVAKYGLGVGNDGAMGCWQAMLDKLAKEVSGE